MVGVNAIGESRGLCLIYQEPQLLVPDFEESNTSPFYVANQIIGSFFSIV